ncbi:hypothetical protein HDU86_006803 [Geranomyces michiganensis]|nr:hypothetical protein HDU86_006803 [Geranomyces michiganensis]
MEELAAQSLVQQRAKEAELEHEMHGLRQTIDVLKKKNESLPHPSEEHTQKIDALSASVSSLEEELKRNESAHDAEIEQTLAHMSKNQRSTGESGSNKKT